MFIARSRARLRRWARLWSARIRTRLPGQAGSELLSAHARCCDRQSIFWSHDEQSCKRAAALLARHLTTGQRRSLCRHGFFTVRTRSGRQYRLWARRDLPVELIDKRKQGTCHKPWLYCVTSDARNHAKLPLGDQMLELKLCLEADEEYFLMTANPKFIAGVEEKIELIRKNMGGKRA